MQEPASVLRSSPGGVSEGQSVNFQSLVRQGQGQSTVLLSNVERGWKRKAGGARAEARAGGRRAGREWETSRAGSPALSKGPRQPRALQDLSLPLVTGHCLQKGPSRPRPTCFCGYTCCSPVRGPCLPMCTGAHGQSHVHCSP